MKKLTPLNLVLFLALSFYCNAQFKTLPNGKQIDKRLVGTWEGSETDNQIEGLTKTWTMVRNDDGTFEFDFSLTFDDEKETSTETGTWWIEDGKFHEFHDFSGLTDVYEYEVLNKKQVKFKSVSIDVEMNKDSYEFIDYKVKAKKKKKDKNAANKSSGDGSSFETAIVVKSVAEEYEYIRANCPDCKVVGQALSQYKNKPYDILTIRKPDGEEVSYYFDISSFFGKF